MALIKGRFKDPWHVFVFTVSYYITCSDNCQLLVTNADWLSYYLITKRTISISGYNIENRTQNSYFRSHVGKGKAMKRHFTYFTRPGSGTRSRYTDESYHAKYTLASHRISKFSSAPLPTRLVYNLTSHLQGELLFSSHTRFQCLESHCFYLISHCFYDSF